MASRSFTQLLLPAFGGQGTPQFFSLDDQAQPLSQSSLSPVGITLLSACYSAFHEELGALNANDREKVGICASQFTDRESILKPSSESYLQNPAFSGPYLVLTHVLQYLSFIEENTSCQESCSLTDILEINMCHGVGIWGFSSGILSACVVGSSTTILSYINHAVETFRLALWIGIRVQIYRGRLLTRPGCPTRPWAVVLSGILHKDLESFITRFNEAADRKLIFVTAVLDNDRTTVSGCPHDLSSFIQTLPSNVVRQETNINSIYHCSALLEGVRDQVLLDVSSRKIRFPEFTDMVAPIRSSVSGDLLSKSSTSASLLKLVIDMVLMQPVNWNLVLRQTSACLPLDAHVSVVDIGLGASLLRGFQGTLAQDEGRRFEVLHPMAQSKLDDVKKKQIPIAIIGMAINMPGASNTDELWKHLESGGNTIRIIPENRFHFQDYTGGNIPGRSMRAQTGNFVSDVDHFDNKFFNISPREARSMDPQQRILLQVGYEALEDSGYVPHASPTFNPTTFGCFIGAATHDYVHNLKNDIDVYYSTGTLKAFLSGRLSYCLGLSGPSIVVDTACSSSLVAIHQACRALMNYDCNAALAGGVNVISSPDMFIGLDRGHFLTPSGQCKPFDASADGYSRGEGCGIFVLKRLSDAIFEKDQVLGVIRGIEVNQSGKASSITRPHAPTQEDLLTQLLRCSDVDAKSVNVVEAHGTGTQAGDTAEMESLRRVLAADRALDNPLYITSIKANVGHLEAASGSASLAKVLLMLKHQIVPRQISLTALNPRFTRLNSDNFIINTDNVAWMPRKAKTPRLAVINNFGAAGSNAALLIEEYIPPEKSILLQANDERSYVFGLSAKTKDSLEVLRSKYMAWLQRPSTALISHLDLSYSTTARRQIYPYRLAVSAGNREELVKRLETAAIVHVTDGAIGPGAVFVFSGQGHANALRGASRSLYATSPVFKSHINECNSILTSCGFIEILSVISGHAPGDRQVLPPVHQEQQQSATFSLQYALSKLWVSWGVRPIAVVGHSLGEYAALVMAGVLPLRDALIVVASRARMILQRCPPMETGMCSISLEAARIRNVLDSQLRFSHITIACFNSPTDCVVSGPLDELEDLRTFLKQEGIAKATRLDVPYGYHSPLMSHLTDELVVLAGKARFFPTRIPFISTVLGCVVMPGDRSFPSQDYVARQCVGPVRFTEAIASYLANTRPSGTTAWLEISAHPSILPMLRSFPALSDDPLLGSLRASEDAWTSLSRSLASFYLWNDDVKWRHVFSDIGSTQSQLVGGLPSYPFTTTKFWVPFVEETPKQAEQDNDTRSSFIKRWLKFPGSGEDRVAIFQTPISQLKHYIKGHRVGGVPLCPASVYTELITSSISLAAEHVQQCVDGYEIVLSQIAFPKPLPWDYGNGDSNATITITIDLAKRSFFLNSQLASSEQFGSEAIHASGEYCFRAASEIEEEFDNLVPSITASIANPRDRETLETFSTRTIYQVIFPRVVEYSPEFQTLRSLSMLSLCNGMEATGTMVLSPDDKKGFFFGQPFFLDTLIHTAGFLSNLRGGQNDAYICKEIGSVQILPAAIKNSTSFTVYCKISSAQLEGENILVGESYALLDTQPQRLVGRFNNIRFKRVGLGGLKAALASIAGVHPSTFIELNRHGIFGDPPLPSSVMATVLRTVASTTCIPMEQISVNQHLEQLGIDSLMRIELSYDLARTFPGFGCRPQELSTCKTVADIVDTILAFIERVPSSENLNPNSPRPLSGFSTPNTLVHSSPSVRRIVARILEVNENIIKDDTQLSSLGLDSLASIEVAQTLRNEFQLNATGSLFTSAHTMVDLEDQISRLEPSSLPIALGGHLPFNRNYQSRFLALSQRRNNTLSVLQNTKSRNLPLVLIHDGSGLTISYDRLSNLNRKVWTIGNPRFGSAEPWASIEEMARSYANLILDEMEGPIVLGGWSFGGVVAFEIARQLRSKSVAVKGLILVDSPSPFIHVPLSSNIIDHVLDNAGNIELETKKHCKNQFTANAQIFSRYNPDKADFTCPTVVLLRSSEPFNLLNVDDSPVPAWLSDRSDASSFIAGWEAMVGGHIRTFDIPGHHFQAFDAQNVNAVSDRISQVCETLDEKFNRNL